MTIVADGPISRQDFDDLADMLVVTNTFAYAKLFDGSRGTTTMSAEDVLAIGVKFRDLQHTYPLGPLAVVIPAERFESVARLLGILATAKRPMRIFGNTEAARRWLSGLRRIFPHPGQHVLQ